MTTNTLRYSGDSKDLKGIIILYFRDRAFTELITLFPTTHSFSHLNTNTFNKLITSKKSLKKYHNMNINFVYVTKDVIDITIPNQFLALLLYLKEYNNMMFYSDYVYTLEEDMREMIIKLRVRESNPECFI